MRLAHEHVQHLGPEACRTCAAAAAASTAPKPEKHYTERRSVDSLSSLEERNKEESEDGRAPSVQKRPTPCYEYPFTQVTS